MNTQLIPFTYHVTGVLQNGKRLKRIVTTSRAWAFGINLWKGTVWQVDPTTGKRKPIKKVFN